MKEMREMGKRIAQLRKKKGYTQEKLVEIIGETNISLETLKRIEMNGIKSFKYLYMISEALEVDLNELIPDELFYAMKDRGDEELDIEHMLWIKDNLYPDKNKDFCSWYPISSLLEFLLYLPLMNPRDLFEYLRRIEGDMYMRENYILGKLRQLYEEIPDSPEKRYADYEKKKINREFYKKGVADDIEVHQYELGYLNHEEEHNEYKKRIDEWKELMMLIESISKYGRLITNER